MTCRHADIFGEAHARFWQPHVPVPLLHVYLCSIWMHPCLHSITTAYSLLIAVPGRQLVITKAVRPQACSSRYCQMAAFDVLELQQTRRLSKHLDMKHQMLAGTAMQLSCRFESERSFRSGRRLARSLRTAAVVCSIQAVCKTPREGCRNFAREHPLG